MTRYVALLRAINVGGRTVKMEQLRRLFEAWGFSQVETFIASGNVIFETERPAGAALEALLAANLQAALGYAVATFIRTPAELTRMAACEPLPPAERAAAQAINIAFLSAPLDDAAAGRLLAWPGEMDTLVVQGREVYWLCRQKQSASTFSNAVLEKLIQAPATLRSLSTVQKMAARYDPVRAR